MYYHSSFKTILSQCLLSKNKFCFLKNSGECTSYLNNKKFDKKFFSPLFFKKQILFPESLELGSILTFKEGILPLFISQV